MALGCLVLQALIGDAQLVLHLTPLFLIVSLLLSGHYVAEDRIVEARLALRPRPRRAPRAPRPAGRERGHGPHSVHVPSSGGRLGACVSARGRPAPGRAGRWLGAR